MMTIPLAHRIAALVPTLDGWCSVEKANELALAVLKLNADVTVEIGVLGGRSLLPLAMAHAEQKHGVVWGIDPWLASASVEGYDTVNAEWWGKLDHEAVYQKFLFNLKAHGLEEWVKVVRQKSDDVAPPDVIDVLHLDGNHSDQTVRDVERYASRVRPGGYVFVDDIHWTGGGVERAVVKLLGMGFVQLFARDTGAMFQREEKRFSAGRAAKPKKRGRPPGSKNKQASKRKTSAS